MCFVNDESVVGSEDGSMKSEWINTVVVLRKRRQKNNQSPDEDEEDGVVGPKGCCGSKVEPLSLAAGPLITLSTRYMEGYSNIG